MLILLVFYKYLLKHNEEVDAITCDRDGDIYRILEQINFKQEREHFTLNTEHKGCYDHIYYSDKMEPLNAAYNRLNDSINNYDEAKDWLKENGFGG